MKKLPERKTILSLYFFVFIFILAYNFYRQIANGYLKGSWQISEFLVNYHGGFVRRGLLGEVLIRLYQYLNFDPYITILVLSISFYLILIVFFIKSFLKRGYPVFILPFVFFLGNPIINNFWLRKDAIISLVFILVIHFSTKKSLFNLFLLNLVLTIGLLMHESLGFFTFPVLLIIFTHKFKIHFKSRLIWLKSTLMSIAVLIPSIFTLIATFYFRGNKEISNIIWDSWKSIPFPYIDITKVGPPGAIDGLSWTINTALIRTFDTLNNFNDGIYAPFGMLTALLVIYFILTNTDKLNLNIINNKTVNNFDKSSASNILILQFLSILPLFILGWDYGRWVFYWTISSFSVLILVPASDLSLMFPGFIERSSIKLNTFLDSILGKSRSFFILLSLITGFCGFSWQSENFIGTSSLFIVFRFFSRIFYVAIEFTQQLFS